MSFFLSQSSRSDGAEGRSANVRSISDRARRPSRSRRRRARHRAGAPASARAASACSPRGRHPTTRNRGHEELLQLFPKVMDLNDQIACPIDVSIRMACDSRREFAGEEHDSSSSGSDARCVRARPGAWLGVGDRSRGRTRRPGRGAVPSGRLRSWFRRDAGAVYAAAARMGAGRLRRRGAGVSGSRMRTLREDRTRPTS